MTDRPLTVAEASHLFTYRPDRIEQVPDELGPARSERSQRPYRTELPVPIEHTCDGSNLRTCQCTKDRLASRQRERRSVKPEIARRDNLRRFYGMTIAEYEELREAQGHSCAVCRRHEDELPERRNGRPRNDGQPNTASAKLVVDHCHREGTIRALLCSDCNAGLGLFADDPERLENAARYLRR